MITFETQEEFENAVMLLIENRLSVKVQCWKDSDYWGDPYGKVEVTLILEDKTEFSFDSDTFSL